VARRPSAASWEKDPAAAGMRRFFSLEQRVEKKDIEHAPAPRGGVFFFLPARWLLRYSRVAGTCAKVVSRAALERAIYQQLHPHVPRLLFECIPRELSQVSRNLLSIAADILPFM